MAGNLDKRVYSKFNQIVGDPHGNREERRAARSLGITRLTPTERSLGDAQGADQRGRTEPPTPAKSRKKKKRKK